MSEPLEPNATNQPQQPAQQLGATPEQSAADLQPHAPVFGNQPSAQPPTSPQTAPSQLPAAPGSQIQPAMQQPAAQVQPGATTPYGHMNHTMPVFTRKDPAIMLLASCFIPGLGSMLSERIGKGVGILIAYFISALLMFLLIGFLTTPVVWVLGMVAAYQDAKAWNQGHGFPE